MTKAKLAGCRYTPSTDELYESKIPEIVNRIDPGILADVACMLAVDESFLTDHSPHTQVIRPNRPNRRRQANGFRTRLAEICRLADLENSSVRKPAANFLVSQMCTTFEKLIETEGLEPGRRYAVVYAHFRFPGGYDLPEENSIFSRWRTTGGCLLRFSTGAQQTYALPKRPEYTDGNLLKRLNNNDPYAPISLWQPKEGDIVSVRPNHLVRRPAPETILSSPYLEIEVRTADVR